MNFFSIRADIVVVNKINDIIKNLSFSYIAGVIFFSLSDTIPFLRRKKLANKSIKKTLFQMQNAIDVFSLSINNMKWNDDTNTKQVFEDFSGCEYADNAPQMRLTSDKLRLIDNLSKSIDFGIDFIISQELYIDSILINDMENIKFNDYFLLMRSIPNNSNDEFYIHPNKIIAIFDKIIEIKRTIIKYL